MRLTLSILGLALSLCVSRAATITPASMVQSEVQAAIDSSSDGDIVQCPAGNVDWTGTLTINKAIQVLGATNFGSRISYGHASGFGIVSIVTTANKLYRFSGFVLTNNPSFPHGSLFGMIQVSGRSHGVRLDTLKFYELGGKIITCIGDNAGVIDNFDCLNSPSSSVPVLLTVRHRDWNGSTDSYGDRSWSSPLSWGTTNTWMMENFHLIGVNGNQAITDGYDGARFGARYAALTNGHFATHGTESTPRSRGTLQLELYNLIHKSDGFVAQSFVRSGSVRQFNCTNTTIGNITALVDYQSRAPYSWGGWNGTNEWCSNTVDVITGTHTGANGAQLIDSSKSLTVNQYVGYHLQNTSVSSFNTVAVVPFAEVSANTGTTFTTYDCAFLGTDLGGGVIGTNIFWRTGDAYRLHKVVFALDAPGSGPGDLLSGELPNVTPLAWPNQIRGKCHYWNNTIGGSPALATSSGYHTIVENRDYFNTDPGDYVPLVYPHPLVTHFGGGGGGEEPPAAPTGFSVRGKAAFSGRVNLQ